MGQGGLSGEGEPTAALPPHHPQNYDHRSSLDTAFANSEITRAEGQLLHQAHLRYLHWLLADPSRVEDAFKAVWRSCEEAPGMGTARREKVLTVMSPMMSPSVLHHVRRALLRLEASHLQYNCTAGAPYVGYVSIKG